MLRTMITATNTMTQVQTQLDTIGSNIANMNTHGYKSKQVNFSEMLYQQFNNDKHDKVVRETPVGIRYGLGMQISQIQTNSAQGSIQYTERDLDFALTTRNQYFNVLMQDNAGETRTAYTRNGSFYVSPTEDGIVALVNSDGYYVADVNGQPITFPDNVKEFTMDSDGTLVVNYENGQPQRFQLAVTSFPRNLEVLQDLQDGTYMGLPENLEELGYTEEDLLVNLQGANRQVSIEQGALEMSNVDYSLEMANLIKAQRSYQFNSRAITIGDQMLGLINGIR